MSSAMIRGWCPGALRPMESGDGLIVRLRLSGGIVDIALAQRIAAWSRQWGNGQIELSNRANLQLRGLSVRHLPDLHDALADHSLLDSSEAGEAIRNVISSPLAGLDPDAVLDIRPIAKSLEQRLAGDTSLHDLPAKFGFSVDDGGLLGLDDVSADVRFVSGRSADGPAFTCHLAGAPHAHLGPCRPTALPHAAAALAKAFLHLRSRGAGIRRMRDLVALQGVEVIAREAGLGLSPRADLAAKPTQVCWSTSDRSVHPLAFLGLHALGSAAFVGVGAAYGTIRADDFHELATTAAADGAQEFRLTPWRAILVPVPSIPAARALAAGLTATRFILDPHDPRRRIAACPGAPSCERATTLVRDDAAILAAELAGVPGSEIMIHVSGCEKGCAHPKPAPATLVGRDGHYDLVANGATSSAPIRRNLTLEQVREQMRHIVAAPSQGGHA